MSNTNNNAELAEFSQDLDRAVRSARNTTIVTAVILALSLASMTYWLNNARNQFVSTLTPEVGSNYAVSHVTEALPEATPKLKEMAINSAPQAFDYAETKLLAVPDQLAATLIAQTREELSKVTPQVEDELYKSLKSALAKAVAERKPGQSDEVYIKGLVEALASTYGTESGKAIDEARTAYKAKGGDLISYLDHLAANQNLNEKETLQRQALVTFLSLSATPKS